MTTSDDDKDYEVGYGKPPKHSQFKKGQSGNPKGRPKGSKNVATIFRERLFSTVNIKENGRRKQITMIEALFRTLLKSGLEGDARAQDRLIKLLPLADADASDAEQDAQIVRTDQTDEDVLRYFFEVGGKGLFDADDDEGEHQ
ncbi:DUF5681 domain-containing protein [Roseovarius indicus]|uniref:DUF5681 domain-containing protein n=1 Tax=Roseovarius indicus TaxID=540747 RepID=A0A0T5PDF7_9RHOB|nr:DUF5681 domain-containing protein [Roseovarius indicus]KRS19181.1 hypothetical protein XM52_05860 [Roseovarius indicus]QEW25858.1 hypothetical protein RIdsm_01647 [Roseovarius indicus]SFD89429.1 hypothetical protein SAMN04488031_10360 [Roseovarius indicus]